ncbi:hypothetical protein [Bradyrhizobium sp. CCBAU 51765]|uniref:hypothetical protein n=1 Tax=Bradyrhizobium sp. CCBAU 51765 TaxID=1325102 RepID=UPI001889AFE7|nr:hypothetical protein [Bradyrhizobium sp. CCBAU 51765]QOZ07253.1 hypothetical protein XH96_06790 [Bradyrhizobium sp. CCBAU 51765]
MPAEAEASGERGFRMDLWGIIGGLGVGGLLGTIGTQWAIGQREQAARRVAFKKQQLAEFYGPLLAAHNEISARSELRVKLQNALDGRHIEAMLEAAASGGGAGRNDRISAATDTQGPTILTNIRDEEQTFRHVLMPRYRSMIDIFRDKMWLAEPETRNYFGQFVEFVDVWDKILENKLPRSVAPTINHTEANLAQFYTHLQEVHDRLRREIS